MQRDYIDNNTYSIDDVEELLNKFRVKGIEFDKTINTEYDAVEYIYRSTYFDVWILIPNKIADSEDDIYPLMRFYPACKLVKRHRYASLRLSEADELFLNRSAQEKDLLNNTLHQLLLNQIYVTLNSLYNEEWYIYKDNRKFLIKTRTGYIYAIKRVALVGISLIDISKMLKKKFRKITLQMLKDSQKEVPVLWRESTLDDIDNIKEDDLEKIAELYTADGMWLVNKTERQYHFYKHNNFDLKITIPDFSLPYESKYIVEFKLHNGLLENPGYKPRLIIPSSNDTTLMVSSDSKKHKLSLYYALIFLHELRGSKVYIGTYKHKPAILFCEDLSYQLIILHEDYQFGRPVKRISRVLKNGNFSRINYQDLVSRE
ncbi:MAG: hypothetical protein U0R17_01405 [Acidimicrobiia bacterium]